MTLLTDVSLFHFYRRFKWNEDDFAAFQSAMIGYPAAVLSAALQNAVFTGFVPSGASGPNINFSSGIAMNNVGDLLQASSGSLTATLSVKSLVVARPVFTDENTITRPTAPFDPVPLNNVQTCDVVVIAGTSGAYPSTQPGDVILFGLTCNGAGITDIDNAVCEYVGKTSAFASLRAYDFIVGNTRDCDVRTLEDALVSAVSGDKIRVRSGGAIDTTIDVTQSDIEIECDPGVVYAKGTATTGFTFDGNGIRFKNGRITGFSTSGNKAITINGNYCTVAFTRFASNDTDVNDVTATSQLVGVISE